LNLIGSWKFFLHFKKLQFDIGAGTSGYRMTQNIFLRFLSLKVYNSNNTLYQ
jgi:hypothetical protein